MSKNMNKLKKSSVLYRIHVFVFCVNILFLFFFSNVEKATLYHLENMQEICI